MLISRKWLSQYMDISSYTIEELADRITAAGLEVEGIERLASGTNLVIGEVVECKDHPDSDHLHVCQVNTGEEVTQIVCGAPNVRSGLKVIVAKPSAVLPEIEIKAGVIRGEVSNGMICSLNELGVDPKNLKDEQIAGIEELDSDAVVGNTDVLAYLGLDDEILDIGLTPNRNDCQAAFAMAKEASAVLNVEVKLPEFKGAADKGEATKLQVFSETEKCSLYSAKLVQHVTVKESPKWMKELLLSSGVKSINNVVDISNLVMLETGQPLHFFDTSKLEKPEIVVKDGLSCEYTALDGETYKIDESDIMITVNNKPVAIGGVMGGDDSKIDEATTSIVIEAANFDHVSVRNSARRLNLNTDASVRFSKKIDPLAPFTAMDRAVQLLVEYADASGLEETVYSSKLEFTPTEIDVNLHNINTLLGTTFSEAEVLDVLTRLDLQPTKQGDNIHVVIPSYRQDLEIEADIIEEVIRILGFDTLPSTIPALATSEGKLNNRQQLRRVLRNVLSVEGFYEAETYTLVSETLKNDAIMKLDSTIQLASPMSEDRKYVRGSILPSILQTIAYNNARSIKDVALFEISNVYAKNYVEERLCIALSGNLQANRWLKYEVGADFYTMKGLIEAIVLKLGYNSSRVMIKENTLDTTHFHPYQSACVYIGKDLLGIFGKVHPSMEKDYDVKNVVAAELNLEVILNNKTSKIKFETISKYPSTSRDLAFVVKEDVKADDIIRVIKSSGKLNGKSIITDVEVFDVYTGEHVVEGSKSIALSVTFQSDDHTLKDDEITTVHNQILENLKSKVQAELRA